MKRFLFNIIPTTLAMSVGIITLLALLFPDLRFDLEGTGLGVVSLGAMRGLFVSWASILAAFALLAGFLNVVGVHVTRISQQRYNWGYSLALLLGVLVVLGAAGYDTFQAQRLDPGGVATRWLFENVIVQLEIAVMALLAFFLTFAAYRALRRPAGLGAALGAASQRPAWGTVLFVLAAVVILLRTVSFASDEIIVTVQNGLTGLVDAAALGGARGLLLGIALGTVVTGLRVLAGVDRPHSE